MGHAKRAAGQTRPMRHSVLTPPSVPSEGHQVIPLRLHKGPHQSYFHGSISFLSAIVAGPAGILKVTCRKSYRFF